MKNCLWHPRTPAPAVAIWTTHRHIDIPLCKACLKDWEARATKNDKVFSVIGYRELTPVTENLAAGPPEQLARAA